MIQDVTNDELWPMLEEKDTLHIVFAYGLTCGPCVSTKPNYVLVEGFFEKLDPSIKFYQIDVWNEVNKPIKEKIEIPSVPTYLAFYNGEVILRDKSAKDTLQLRDFVFRGVNEMKLKKGVS